MLPFSPAACLLGLLRRGEVSKGGGGGGGGGAVLSLLGEMVSSNQRPRMGSLSSSANSEQTGLFLVLAGVRACIAGRADVSTNRCTKRQDV